MNFFDNFKPEKITDIIKWNWAKFLYKIGILRLICIDIRQTNPFDDFRIKFNVDLAAMGNEMPWCQYSSYPDDPARVHFEALVTCDYDDAWLKEMKA